MGVNTDETREQLQLAQKKHDLNWRSWWDGASGPIAFQWKIMGLPTFFLLDHKGLIRWENIGSPDLKVMDQLIEQLVQEAEAERDKQ